MQYPKPNVMIAVVVLGLVFSTVGMLGYTGLIHLSFSKYLMFAGYGVTIVGLVLIYLDMREIISEGVCNDTYSNGKKNGVPSKGESKEKDGVPGSKNKKEMRTRNQKKRI